MTLDEAYEALGLKRVCTEAEAKIAYRHLAMTTHPDKVSDRELGHTQMATLNSAWELVAADARAREPAPTSPDDPCDQCGGTKKVTVGKGFSKMTVVCPKCQK